jgi:hypothetical protein
MTTINLPLTESSITSSVPKYHLYDFLPSKFMEFSSWQRWLFFYQFLFYLSIMHHCGNAFLLFLHYSFPWVSLFSSSFTTYSNIFRLVFLFSNKTILYPFRFVSSRALSIFTVLLSQLQTMSNTSGNFRPYFDSEESNTRPIQHIALSFFRYPLSCSSSHFSLKAPIPDLLQLRLNCTTLQLVWIRGAV